MAAAHPFTPSQDNPRTCGHRSEESPGYLGGECGLPASNRAVHAPGVVEETPKRHLTVIRTDSAAVAHGAPETSMQAARRTLPRRGSLRFQIVARFAHPSRRDYGWTCDELERDTRKAHTTVSSAINGLKNDGIIVPRVAEGERVTRPTAASGSPATVYVLTADGRAAYYAESTPQTA